VDSTYGELPAFDDALPAFDEPLAAFWDGDETIAEIQAGEDRAAGLTTDLAYAYKPRARTFVDLTKVKAAADHLKRLPEPAEAIHCICSGRYSFSDTIGAVAALAAPVAIAELWIATLSFNLANVEALTQLHDQNRIRRINVVGSYYFSRVNPHLWQPLVDAMHARGQSIVAVRNHAKINAFRMDDGRSYVIEGSCNLRSAKCVEQFCFVADDGLYEFHRGWMSQLMNEGGHHAQN
jgi:hypothetical protein